MYCSNCGKEISEDYKVCGYCGAPVNVTAPTAGNSAQFPNNNMQVQNNNMQVSNGTPQYNNGAPQYNNGIPQYNNGYPQYNNGYPQYNNGYQQYNNGYQQYNGGSMYQQNYNTGYDTDRKFNFVAAFFPWIWGMVKGMWDMALISLALSLLGIPLAITGVGLVISIPVTIAQFLLFGRNANYYYRLKEERGITFFKAVSDPNLRRI